MFDSGEIHTRTLDACVNASPHTQEVVVLLRQCLCHAPSGAVVIPFFRLGR